MENGERMSIIPEDSTIDATESNDTAGYVFFKGGTVTAWYRAAERMSGPSWTYNQE